MTNQKWNLIFHTTKYDFVIIKNNFMMNSVELLQNFLNEILAENNFSVLLPPIEDIRKKNNSNYLKKYIGGLKEFIDSKEKNVLIIEEGLLGILVKEDKKENFLKFLLKNNKKIVIIAEGDWEHDIKKISTNPILIMDEESFEISTLVFNRFENIKMIFKATFEPFSDPLGSYKKMIKN